MANPIYTAIASLDGYVADADGKFEWAGPDREVHEFVNGLERAVGTYLRPGAPAQSQCRTSHARRGSHEGRLVDECHLILMPVVIGSGLAAFSNGRRQLELLDHRRFGTGADHLHFRVNN